MYKKIELNHTSHYFNEFFGYNIKLELVFAKATDKCREKNTKQNDLSLLSSCFLRHISLASIFLFCNMFS